MPVDSMTQVLSHARKSHVCGSATYAWVWCSVHRSCQPTWNCKAGGFCVLPDLKKRPRSSLPIPLPLLPRAAWPSSVTIWELRRSPGESIGRKKILLPHIHTWPVPLTPPSRVDCDPSLCDEPRCRLIESSFNIHASQNTLWGVPHCHATALVFCPPATPSVFATNLSS